MDLVDLIVAIVVVTILVTVVVGVVTYLAYKMRMAREPAPEEEGGDGPRYFVVHRPPAAGDGGEGGAP